MQELSKKIKKISDLEMGDVLLCCIDGQPGTKINENTNGKYSHAAIFIGENKIAHSNIPQGVEIHDVNTLTETSDYIAVLRSDAWKISENKRILLDFVKEKAAVRRNYNIQGIKDLKENKDNLINNTRPNDMIITQQLDEYFNDPKDWCENKEVFCSEFIMECFLKTGYFGNAMHVAYNPTYTSPNDITRDRICGMFYGYITNDINLISEEDFYYYEETLDLIDN